MEALIATYGGDASSDSDSDDSSPPILPFKSEPQTEEPHSSPLPPPPVSLLHPPNSLGSLDFLQTGQPSRVRSFPHVEGNYALHVYIPVFIPSVSKKEMGQFLKKVSSFVPGLHVVDIDVPLNVLCKEEHKLEQVALGREFHISLGRTVPIRVHQIDSIVTMLRQKLQFQKRYWIDFNKWEVFVNDDKSRTFVSLEVVSGGLAEITKQIQAVNEVYKLHSLPEFYKDPRPHISLAWALGDISGSLKKVINDETKSSGFRGSLQSRICTSKFGGIECKIGNKTYIICKPPDQ
ncbi:U6 snRNA phosphodiesterase [Hibiscus syriacus]|uniref:U6 snRNA phosphodiesterase n=1 Tax=Hibiscus syriacus TaxID=106335 RepID=UPI001922EFCA|nr:U6 snRNA phosphodiesterase [Hibiscus syriacus]